MTESFSFIANIKIEFLYLTSGKFTKNNHPSASVYSMVYLSVVGSYVCKFVGQFVGLRLCLLLGLSVC